MNGAIKIYRRFYRLNFSNSGNTTTETYTAINPVSLTADVYDVTAGNTLVESGATVTNSSTGLYYADLNEVLYSTDHEYEIYWHVQYTSDSEEKLQYTRFKFKMAPIVGQNIDVEILNNKPLEFTVVHNHLN